MCTNENDLEKLLQICSDWADDWQLTFSQKKSKTLTNQPKIERVIHLQGKVIEETNEKVYKYLGIPITKTGVDVKKYHAHILNKFYISKAVMQHYCAEKNLTGKHRLIIYKSIVRSQFDYGTAITNYNTEEIKKME